ncbi:hypothetical protein ACFSUS_28050 [Spirosoma soli]|uniref:Uncharacterized protein n=1 Tax=Spirosoma soli TaxID=1770529 RepID=A0ABW5MEJ8_9BACT
MKHVWIDGRLCSHQQAAYMLRNTGFPHAITRYLDSLPDRSYFITTSEFKKSFRNWRDSHDKQASKVLVG